jgi:AcrR family transcriptional regulator
VSGPALYRHFDSKESILAELLIDASEQLLREGRERVESATSPHDALRSLISFHTEFALRDRDLIRIQDHDFANLGSNDAKTVSRLQRAYIEVWMSVLSELDPTLAQSVIRTKVQAVFGLLNSTPHSAPRGDVETTRGVLEAMAIDAFRVSSLSAKTPSR